MSKYAEIYLLFARLLDYPTSSITEEACKCVEIFHAANLDAGEILVRCLEQIEQTPLEKLGEIYTYTFDLQGTCPPYVGHHLFGESNKRNWFMARLNEQYRKKNFNVEKELPDHIMVILRFLALHPTGEFSQVLNNEGLRPAVSKMLGTFTEGDGNPYWQILSVLSSIMEDSVLSELNTQVGSEIGGSDDG
jgi:nitrate reductase delta subunit